MSVPKIRHAAFGLAAAGVLSAGVLATVGHGLQSAPALQAAEPATTPPPADRTSGVRVSALGAVVNVDKERGKVTVQAPDTHVDVDPDKGHVKVRAPYVNLDVRW